MQVIIDRFEEGYAVVELPNRKTIAVPAELFPDAKAGDVIDIMVDRQSTNDRKNSIRDKFERLHSGISCFNTSCSC